MLEDILNDSTLTSADYLAGKALQEGDLSSKFMGFNWIPFEGIDPVASSTFYTIAWCKDAIHWGEGFMEGRVDRAGRLDGRRARGREGRGRDRLPVIGQHLTEGKNHA